MSDQPTPQSPPDDEALAAWLAGDLDPAADAAVEAALDDPVTAARLDAIADVVARLRRVDEVTPPDGFERRLRPRLDEARRSAPATVTSLEQARARRTWTGVGAAAAVLVVLALGSLAVLQGVGGSDGGSAEVAMDDSAAGGADTAQQFSTTEAAPATEVTPERATAGDAPPAATAEEAPAAAADSSLEDAAQPPGPPQGPVPRVPPAAEATLPGPDVVLDETLIEAADDATVFAAFADLPELQAVMGMPVAEADTAAIDAIRALATAPALGGSAADACVQTGLGDRQPTLVVRVQALAYAGREGVAYVVASSQGDQVVDYAEVVVVEPATCTVLTAVPLTER